MRYQRLKVQNNLSHKIAAASKSEEYIYCSTTLKNMISTGVAKIINSIYISQPYVITKIKKEATTSICLPLLF